MIKVGERLFNNLDSNEYLHKLFRKIAYNYSSLLVNSTFVVSITEKEKIDALRFADILSKCTIEAKKDLYFNWAQNIVTMLNTIYKNDDLVKYCLGSVLTNVNNYFGVSQNSQGYINQDIVEGVKELVEQEEYKIPCENAGYFINKQKTAFDFLKRNDSYSFSAPTSLGKTFVIRMFIKEIILKGERANFVIVVPTNALINELYERFVEDLNDNLWDRKYKVVKSPAAIIDEEDSYNFIMIYTQERLLYHLLQVKDLPINYLFIDEAHKITKGEDRSAFFYKVMSIVNKEHSGARVYFSSPNIPNPQVYLELVNDNLNRASTRIKYSPVNQSKILIDQDSGKVSFYSDVDEKFYELAEKNDLIEEREQIISIVKKLGKNKSNIVFCESKKNAVNWAKQYAENMPDIIDEELNELIEEISEDIHADCYLTATLKKGVAYHVAYIPSRIKEKIEQLFKKNIIKTVFCTSTLLEGVNFPAENLFLMLDAHSYWLKDDNRVDFKNLIGRVGRIEFNMFGNIFLISNTETNEKYIRAIERDIDDQRLSVDYYLSENRKKEIVDTLVQGKTVIEKKNGETYDQYNFSRYVLNILLKDIICGQRGKFYKLFDKYLNIATIEEIKNQFKNNSYVQDDITTTPDQIQTVDNEIKVSQITYPDNITYRNVLSFLTKLFSLFNWDRYESKKDIGKESCLKYYSVILQQWMLGLGVKQIIEGTIKFHQEKREIFIDGKKVLYLDSVEQRNYLINDILDTLERIIQFKIKNYFLKFTERKLTNGQELKGNDWYEYVEYGTCNRVVVYLQKIGFTRESAIYIYSQHKDKIIIKDNMIVELKSSLLKCPKISEEVQRVKYNYRNLFNE